MRGTRPIAMQTEDDDSPQFSRSGATHPLGKLMYPAKTDLPQCVGDALLADARELGVPTAEVMRDILCWHYFHNDMEMLMERRRRVFVRNRPESERGEGSHG